MSSLQYHLEDGVATLTLNRPEVHNAFDDELIGCLTDTLLAVGSDTAVRVVVLTGAGKSFSAGADLNWMRRMAEADAATNEHDALHLARLMRTLNYLHKPTIARVNGAAIGGGMGLVACCDIAVAAENAVFATSEVRLGLAPAVISPYVFRKIGESHARRYFLTGERFDAAHALHIGLVHEVTAADALDSATLRFTEELAKGGPQAQAQGKALAGFAGGHSIDTQLKLDQHTAQLIARLRTGDEGREGMRAFLDKRAPGWISAGADPKE
ncbi:enoyl-CoA hydratase/isomerase family protein [Marinihelvus fidelis]|uniref:Enoyl-CoA hydratase/isomerase family protein n=1 Tax=Marinihelvus fidelis TaxID=2613842 RepID=A0A5N0TJC6_9GAMM|nr:enoyl-CoA hydratase/isomerase family protein [Marinihelvus fidelis]KAA9133986.1 enoyl-CoA hydratase/isomerase family protein [Marinihelvus fidelis]